MRRTIAILLLPADALSAQVPAFRAQIFNARLIYGRQVFQPRTEDDDVTAYYYVDMLLLYTDFPGNPAGRRTLWQTSQRR
jgi:hypothetical protein